MTDTDESRALAQLNAAHQWLMQADDVDSVLTVMAMADAAARLAERARWGTHAANAATTIRLLSLLRLRKVIDDGQARGEIRRPGQRYPGDTAAKTLSELGVTKRLLTDSTTLAAAYDDTTVETLRDQHDAKDQPLSYSTIVREARYIAAHERRDQQADEDARFVQDNPPGCDLRVGDFRDVLDDLAGTVDAIITDPPYELAAVPLMADLAQVAGRLLRPDGVLVVMQGSQALPDVYRHLDSGPLPYRWTAAYLTSGAHAVHYARRTTQGWKPLIVYGGGPRFHDVFASPGDDKRHHYWGQSLGGFLRIVDTFTRPGQLVVDPFLGGGTTGAACQRLQRSFVGCDVDADAVETSRQRLTSRFAVDDPDLEDTDPDDAELVIGEVIPIRNDDDG